MINGNERVTLLICQKRSIMLNTPGLSQSCPQHCAGFMNNSSGKLSFEGATLPRAAIRLLLPPSPRSVLRNDPRLLIAGGTKSRK